MQAVFSLFISGMIISDEKEYGPIGIISALMAYLIAIGVVIILGAVVGLVWQERTCRSGPPSANCGGPGDPQHQSRAHCLASGHHHPPPRRVGGTARPVIHRRSAGRPGRSAV
jgi:uncharacterized BrkB/YihY/UPF0761 family membrane protein